MNRRDLLKRAAAIAWVPPVVQAVQLPLHTQASPPPPPPPKSEASNHITFTSSDWEDFYFRRRSGFHDSTGD